MAKPKKKRVFRTDEVKAAIVAEAKATTIAAASRANAVSASLITRWMQLDAAKLAASAPAPAAPKNGKTNGHAATERARLEKPVTTGLQITGLTALIREQVRADFRTIVREELAAMFGGKAP